VSKGKCRSKTGFLLGPQSRLAFPTGSLRPEGKAAEIAVYERDMPDILV
jgi:hypothetical protein